MNPSAKPARQRFVNRASRAFGAGSTTVAQRSRHPQRSRWRDSAWWGHIAEVPDFWRGKRPSSNRSTDASARHPYQRGLGFFFWLAFAVLALPAAFAQAPPAQTAASAEKKIPVSLIVDDGVFYSNKVPNTFLKKFGEWSIANGVKGKFSVIPIYGGKAAIDGSNGEYPGTTKEERLEWIETIKTLITPRWTITPEIITHGKPWDIKNQALMTDMPRESDWLAGQSLETQTEYITEAMRLLKNVGIEFGGLTMCWHYPPEKSHILGEATLTAAEKVAGLKFVMIFNDKGERPGVIYKRADGAMAVSMRPALTDLLDYSDKFTEADVQRLADKYISADGTSGQFVDQLKKGVCLEFYTHYANLYSGGTYRGLEVLTIAIGRLNKFYGDRIEWMTGLDICKRFSEIPEAAPK